MIGKITLGIFSFICSPVGLAIGAWYFFRKKQKTKGAVFGGLGLLSLLLGIVLVFPMYPRYISRDSSLCCINPVTTEYPENTIHLTGPQIETGLFPTMKRVNRACTFPGEAIRGPDFDYYMLKHGDEVIILEQDLGCTEPKGGASKVRSVETGLEGWLSTIQVKNK